MTTSLASLDLPSEALVWQVVLLAVVSLAVGLLEGAVGLALGTMRLPALLLLGFPAVTAAGVNILVSTLAALTGGYAHLRARRVQWRVVATMGIPSVVGALLGALLADRVPEAALVGVVGMLVGWQGAEFLRMARRQRWPSSGSPGALTSGRWAVEGGIGLAVGVVGGAVGLILGSLRLPALVRVLHMDPRMVPGTNLMIGFFMGVAGWLGHAAQGQVDYPVLLAMVVSAMVGTYGGARLGGRMSAGTLVLLMGLVLIVVGLLLVARAVGVG